MLAKEKQTPRRTPEILEGSRIVGFSSDDTQLVSAKSGGRRLKTSSTNALRWRIGKRRDRNTQTGRGWLLVFPNRHPHLTGQ